MEIRIVKPGLIAAFVVCLLAMSAMQVSAASPQVVKVSAGQGSGAALLSDGTVWTWGVGTQGELGNGGKLNSPIPVKANISNVTDVSSGCFFMLAVKDDGTVWGWGDDYGGNLGRNTSGEVLSPIHIPGIANAVKVYSGFGDCFALDKDGTLWAWGRDYSGELGIGRVIPFDPNATLHEIINVPVKVDIDNVKDVGLCDGTTFVLKNDGTLWASGDGSSGLLGNGGTGSSDTFVQVPISGIKSIGCGRAHILAVKDDGTLWSWGDNRYEQTGSITSSIDQPIPAKVDGIADVVGASGGAYISLAVKNDGTVWVWGENQEGAYGTADGWGPDSERPVQVQGLDHVKAISAGPSTGFAIKDDGTLWVWGWNSGGSAGVGTVVPVDDPTGFKNMFVAFPTQLLFDGKERLYYPQSRPSPTPTPFPSAFPMPPAQSGWNVTEKWSVGSTQTIDYIAGGDNGSLYAFANNTINRYDGSGKLEWTLTIPEQWRVCNSWLRPTSVTQSFAIIQQLPAGPVCAMRDGYLYLYATPNVDLPSNANSYLWDRNFSMDGLCWDIFAISPDGKIAWSAPLKTDITSFDDTAIRATGDRVYVFHCYNETVFDNDGNVLFNVPDVSDPAAIDENGYLYVSPAISRYWEGVNKYPDGNSGTFVDFRTPSNTLEALYPNGSVCWQKDLGRDIERQYLSDDMRTEYGSVPIYQENTLYVAFRNGIEALSLDGDVKWVKAFDNGSYKLFGLMPLDSHGNVYLQYVPGSGSGQSTSIEVVGPDGIDACPPRDYTNTYSIVYRSAAKDGILYQVSPANVEGTALKPLGDTSLYDLSTVDVTAYDIINGSVLWSYELPAADKHEAIVGEDNIDKLLYFSREDREPFIQDINHTGIIGVASDDEVGVYPAKDAAYIGYSLTNYESPVVYGKSRCVYASGIIALAANGTPMLETSPSSRVTMISANNSTLFFLTGDGEISALAVDGIVIIGLALLGAAAIIVKFFMAGSVVRARSRIDKNDNRNTLLKYVTDNPGVTMYDISKATGMNLGTVRYHLLILGLNHRIATFKDDNKYIRYFPNSNRYSKEEQLIVSMMRRDTVKRVIQLLFMKPGLTNSEISSVTGLADSGVSRYLKELCDKGIAIRSEATSGRYVYSLTEEASKTVEKLYWVMNGENKTPASGSGNAEA